MRQKFLFVCLGNICRSPAAEAVFLHSIKAKGIELLFEVDSAGTGGWHKGNPADSRMREAANKRGIDICSRARQITFEDLQTFDLILTMDNDNYSVVSAIGSELGQKATAKIKPILSYSKQVNLTEVPDPYYGGPLGFEKVLDLLEDACEGLLAELILME